MFASTSGQSQQKVRKAGPPDIQKPSPDPLISARDKTNGSWLESALEPNLAEDEERCATSTTLR